MYLEKFQNVDELLNNNKKLWKTETRDIFSIFSNFLPTLHKTRVELNERYKSLISLQKSNTFKSRIQVPNTAVQTFTTRPLCIIHMLRSPSSVITPFKILKSKPKAKIDSYTIRKMSLSVHVSFIEWTVRLGQFFGYFKRFIYSANE